MHTTNDPGLWQHFVNRFDNVGRPIMEVKQKYLLEINAYESTLAFSNSSAGGGTAPIASTIPTIDVTPSVTPTISITPTRTPTISITPTRTPTISITPTRTPTISITPTRTPTPTPTPSTQAPTVYSFPLFNCAGRIPFPNDTAYSLSSTFTAGIQIFQNPSLTNLINPSSVGNPIDIYDIQGSTTTDHYGLQADGYVIDSGGDCGN